MIHKLIISMRKMIISIYSLPSARVFYPDEVECFTFEREDFCGGYPVYSGLMVCPTCCRIWAKLAIEGQDYFEPRGIPCAQHSAACHPDLCPVAGSLLDNPTINGWDTAMLAAMPPELLQREFDLHLRAEWHG